MYGPRGRATAFIYVFCVTMIFVGALALPFLIQEEIVAPRFGDGDGFRIHSGLPDEVPQGASLGDRPDLVRPPAALVSNPETSANTTFTVAWTADGPSAHIHYVFHIQYAALSEGASGEWTWEDWFGSRRVDAPKEAAFTGMADEVYAFRGRTCTMLQVACSDWSAALTTKVAADAEPAEVRLEITPRFPADGSTVSGHTAIVWDRDHAGPGTGMVEVGLRSEATGVWSPLYSGTGASASWDTTRHDDGPYGLRLVVRDGVFSEEVLIGVVVANDAAPGDTDAGPDDEAADPDAQASDVHSEEGPASVAALLLITLGLLVHTGNRRRR